jgi:hypothetical protein
MPFRNAKTLKIELADYGSYLGRAEGCFEVRSQNGKAERYPHFEKEIGEAVLKVVLMLVLTLSSILHCGT